MVIVDLGCKSAPIVTTLAVVVRDADTTDPDALAPLRADDVRYVVIDEGNDKQFVGGESVVAALERAGMKPIAPAGSRIWRATLFELTSP